MIVRLKYMFFALHGDDPTKDRTDTSLISEVTLHVNIILATVPCAKPFFVVFEGGAFKSPTHPMHTSTDHSHSFNATGGSGHTRPPMAPRLPSQRAYQMSTPPPSPSPISAMPIIWDLRQSFARSTMPVQEPKPTVKARASRIGPWSFRSRRVAWAKRRSLSDADALSPPPGSERSSRSRKSTRTRFSSPWSSLRSSATRQARSELLSPREPEQRDHSQESRLSPRPHSRTRRQSEVD